MSDIKNGTFTLGIANEGEVNMKYDDLKTWKPNKVIHSTGVTLFEYNGKFYSMKFTDYKEIFGN